MSTAAFEHGILWTEEEFLALGETSDRVELFDGSLHVTPSASVHHQRCSYRLHVALDGAAAAAGLEVLENINVRLRPDRIPISDLAITEPIPTDRLVVDAALVRLVCEIVSPSNAATDPVLKMHYYAEAGIAWYLLVEQQPSSLSLFRLEGEHYTLHAKAEVGSLLHMDEPVRVSIDPGMLG
jgi:Uma2 family endonuclease